jgi:DNA (cytosine-5)-methyltransferase 1
MNFAYYNEFDPNAAAWLRELIKRGLITDGEVDERSVLEVQPEDLKGFVRHHFFAGIGVWDYALQGAGFPADRRVLTASLPCQPFSSAGAQKGKADERHLLPHFLELIARCDMPLMFFEQVEAAIKHGWLDGLIDSLNAQGYEVATSIIPAAAVGAPHIRSRMWAVATR